MYGTEINPDRRKRRWKATRVEQPQSISTHQQQQQPQQPQQQQPQQQATSNQQQSQATTRQRLHTGVRRPDFTDITSNQVDAGQNHLQSAGQPGPFSHRSSMQHNGKYYFSCFFRLESNLKS